MRIIVDFTDSKPNGKIFMLSRRQLTAIVFMLLAAAALAVYITAQLIATYWVSSGAEIASTIAKKEIAAVNEDRTRLWKESIGALENDISAINTRIIALQRRGSSLSERIGLSGVEMFNLDNSEIADTMLCTNDNTTISTLSPEEQHINITDMLYQQNKELDKLEQKYDILREQNTRKTVLEETLPTERPVMGKHWVSSRYGYRRDPFTGRRAFHSGDDYAARRGTPIVASADGIVIYAGRLGNYGNTVQLYHGNEISTLYGHMHKINVKTWQYVNQGDIIGSVGSTGRSTGPHLHYEIRINNRPKSVLKTIKQLRQQRNISSSS